LSDEEIAAIKKALEEMAEHNKKDLSDFRKYLKDEVVHGIHRISKTTQMLLHRIHGTSRTVLHLFQI